MKRFFLLIAAALFIFACANLFAQTSPTPAFLKASSSSNAGMLYYDATNFSIEGKGWKDTGGAYQRLPKKAKGKVPPAVWDLSLNTAGICVRFVTNSKTIAAVWDGGDAMNHMAATGNSGLDLYRKDGKDWIFCGVGRPKPTLTTATLTRDPLSGETQEFLLYLPLYHKVDELKIGVEKNAFIAPAPERPVATRLPIVFYGTSITQGGCASRAGMCHPAILGRWLDRAVINLGFSGAGKMEPALAELVSELDACLYVLETLPNMTNDLVKERVEPFVLTLRKAHPKTPILLVAHPNFPDNSERNTLLKEIFDKLRKDGIDNLYYLPSEKQLGSRENGTVDGVHPTDLGFFQMATVYEPVLRGILSK